MSESMGKETKQNSSKSDKKNINHIDNSIESQTDGPGSILEIKDLCFAYPEEEKRALNHISFQIKEGEFLVLLSLTAKSCISTLTKRGNQ